MGHFKQMEKRSKTGTDHTVEVRARLEAFLWDISDRHLQKLLYRAKHLSLVPFPLSLCLFSGSELQRCLTVSVSKFVIGRQFRS